ncbi:MAG: glycosyltransferase family 4 protein [Candidatus Tyrphobacter sp.]
MKPLILHVAAFTNPQGGGFVSAISRLALDERFDTALLVPPSAARFAWRPLLERSGVRVLYAASPMHVVSVVARTAPSRVHAHFTQWMLPAMLGGRACGARVAWHLHSGVAPSAGARTIGRRAKYAGAKRFVDRFFCASGDIVRYLEGYGIPSVRIVELANGVDLRRFRPPTLKERAAARLRYALGPRDRVIAFFGRDALVKGADLLARAARFVPESTAVLTIAPSQATASALRGVRTIDAGSLLDVRGALWAADAVALPSRSEGLPYSLLEARACGLAAVASPLEGVVRALGGDAGTELVDPHDARRFAQSLERAFASGIVPLAREIAEAISIDRWAERLAEWYAGADAA